MTQDKTPVPMVGAALTSADAAPLLTELRQLIAQARQSAAVAVNAGLALMYYFMLHGGHEH